MNIINAYRITVQRIKPKKSITPKLFSPTLTTHIRRIDSPSSTDRLLPFYVNSASSYPTTKRAVGDVSPASLALMPSIYCDSRQKK